MLRKIKQISLALACMILLLHAVVPHHHHNNEVCLSKLSHKEYDNHSCCDSHDTPNHSNTDDCNKSDCIIDDLFAPKDNHEVKIYLDVNILFSDYHLVLFAKDFIENILKNKEPVSRRDFVPLIYQNPYIDAIFGLRAPPK
ncbi:MAG: hypothetical protein IJZ87_08210 [Bacteroidales bacterium]|nr:hypothetical protein [Bacteroidales bacterium]